MLIGVWTFPWGAKSDVFFDNGKGKMWAVSQSEDNKSMNNPHPAHFSSAEAACQTAEDIAKRKGWTFERSKNMPSNISSLPAIDLMQQSLKNS